MCQTPGTLANGQKVACRKCKLCKKNRIKDWAGRNTAEKMESTASFACDLTYGPELDEYPRGHAGKYGMPIPGRSDHIRAAVLTYSDVQNCLNYMRTVLKYEFSYFITGEMGSLKGRAHWHIIFHFRGKVPTHEVELNFSDRHRNEFGRTYDHDVCKAWPHGFMYWKPASYEDVYYNCKYIQKDESDDKSQRKPGMSKKPPLGARYFAKLAEQYVRQGIAPQDLLYRLPGIKKKKTGEPVEFLLSGRSAELYLDHFVKKWDEQRPNQPMPKSDLVENFIQYGKVVKDEWAMLVREEFPKGESRQAIPSGSQVKAAAPRARAEAYEAARMRELLPAERDDFKFIMEAEDGEERQARRYIVQFREAERWRELRKRVNANWHLEGFWFDRSNQWTDRPQGDEPCNCGHCGEPSEPAVGVLHNKRGDGRGDPTGPVGRWNTLYPREAKTEA